MATLVTVPCGKRKIWDIDPEAGPTPAREVYQGVPFKINREYAEKFADQWFILSAKYGFIEPDFVIPENYNVTFDDPESNPISLAELQAQVRDKGLDRFDLTVALGSTTYAETVRNSFAGTRVTVIAPTAGLPIGRAIGQVRRAIDENRPWR
jgi:hypothetical protein